MRRGTKRFFLRKTLNWFKFDRIKKSLMLKDFFKIKVNLPVAVSENRRVNYLSIWVHRKYRLSSLELLLEIYSITTSV